MSEVYFITHPDALIDPDIPVPLWDLSPKGLRRLEILIRQSWIQKIQAIFSSKEQKARTAAERIASELDMEVVYLEELGEIDRSSTGYLVFDEHNWVVDEFFAHPTENIRGWESAIDAQQRIIQAVKRTSDLTPRDSSIAIVSHAGMGTLLLNHLKHHKISRADAAPDQGFYFVFDGETRKLLQDWAPIDSLSEQ